MSRKILILDTSVLCCWLRIPKMEEAGPLTDRWNHDRIDTLLKEESAQGSTFVLPLASLIETGNHVAQAVEYRFELATALTGHFRDAADANSPWAAFTEQSPLWDSENLRLLADSWPVLAVGGLSIGDATIKGVAEYYASAGYTVEIITGDQGLKAYEPAKPVLIPRRRQ